MKKIAFAVIVALFSAMSFAANGFDLTLGSFYGAPKGAGSPPKDQAERQSRLESGANVMMSYQVGEIEASKGHSYLVFIWGDVDQPVVRQVVGRKSQGGRIERSSFEDVTGKVKTEPFIKNSVSGKLGEPTKIYRVSSPDVAVSLIFPWSEKLDAATKLVCAESATIYPGKGADGKDQGLWVMPGQMAAVRNQGAPGAVLPFFYNK